MKTYSTRSYCKSLLLVFTAVLVSACSQSGGDASSQKAVEVTSPSAADKASIMLALYNNVRTPDGFYHEVLPSDGFYTISHVKNTDLLAPGERAGVASYELSTDDFAQALDWSETAADNQASYKPLVDNSETGFYLQFTREDPAAPGLVHLSRVFKQSALNRSGVDRNSDGAYQGRVSASLLEANTLKTLLEYLWLFSFNNNYGHAVLSSSMSETADVFRHSMLEATLIAGVGAACDRIDVYESRYETDRASGMIWKTRHLSDSFLASNTNGELAVCMDDEGL